jgi:hypothetical protein
LFLTAADAFLCPAIASHLLAHSKPARLAPF